MPSRPRKSTGVQCEILIWGNVKSSWLDQLSELSLSNTQTEEGGTCLLTGHVSDQAALLGVLNGLDGLGLALISINCRTIEPRTS